MCVAYSIQIKTKPRQILYQQYVSSNPFLFEDVEAQLLDKIIYFVGMTFIPSLTMMRSCKENIMLYHLRARKAISKAP